MNALCRAATALSLLVLAGCSSEDPRLPDKLYEEAISLTQQGRNQEAQALLKRLASQYPDTKAGRDAVKDLYTLDGLVRQEVRERQRALHGTMKRVADALTRYRSTHGEYPRYLSALVPDYLDQAPETPWKHPFLYRPYVTVPIADVKDRRGRVAQVFNTKLDGYILCSLGLDLQIGGEDLAEDSYIVNGEPYKGAAPPPIPQPQPLR
ncbi:outer membrane protein assembly factor BamD [Mesoterricola sediminis]|uniref:Tetratricopeptide repeat protein n=1 Tax=Mesoterricola sediminis TaxID=2927980 RepID=A0AA48KDG5_9BACT|nr:hypothetical protein [Mesoterricola sediminis]BDU77045.1 hypothetical protein METESE_20030 [Mesoterricola sediminis]